MRLVVDNFLYMHTTIFSFNLTMHSFLGLMTGARTCDLLVTTTNARFPSDVNITWSQAECRECVTDTFMCVKLKKTYRDMNNNLPCPARWPCSCFDDNNIPDDMPDGAVNCYSEKLYTIPVDMSQNVTALSSTRNKIRYIEHGMFQGMSNLTKLDLDYNEVHGISSFGFKGLDKLEYLSIKNNEKSIKFEFKSFGGLHKLNKLDLSYTRLQYPRNNKLFQDLILLEDLRIVGCGIKREEDVFLPNPHLLRHLYISQLTIFNTMFKQPTNYSNLEELVFGRVPVNETISNGQFDGLNKLRYVAFIETGISRLKPAIFSGLDSLATLMIQSCNIDTIEQETFTPLKNIEKIMIYQDTLPKYPVSLFQGLEKLTEVESDHMEFCCIVPTTVKTCSPQPDHLSSCGDLVKNNILRVFLWTFGICILLANSAVIILRFCEGTSKHGVNEILIMNLSLSDMIIGVYIIIIASMDLKYRGIYYQYQSVWRKSGLCMASGFIASLSSEMSVYILVVMTLDRFLKIVFPFKMWLHFSKRAAHGTLIFGWILCITLTALPLLPIDYFSPHEFYTQSGFCLPLMLNYDSAKEAILKRRLSTLREVSTTSGGQEQSYSHFNGWEYSFALFNVVNLIAFFLIAAGYLAIFFATRISRSKMKQGKGNEQDRRLATKLMWIVATDFCCWVPIIILGFLTFYKVTLPGDIIAYISIFVLPINSAINPILYTFSTLPWKDIWKKCKCRSALKQPLATTPGNTNDSAASATTNTKP
ncbi:unnamed protein product [Owenia fusiformis]|uniref:Uncharacterized protein n=1 Tax=Owenia fusiformis TaxID=6347 RepID=A0A8J1TE53_OWEFU|nr:unnamed protein product [Owenia fusiformis]